MTFWTLKNEKKRTGGGILINVFFGGKTGDFCFFALFRILKPVFEHP